MRHFVGLILAVISSAALLAGGCWGVGRLSSLTAQGAGLTGPEGVLAMLAVAGAGLVLGILLVVPAVSPIATGLPGITLLAWSVLLVLSAHRALGWLPAATEAPWTAIRALLGNGTFALLGMAMIIPLFVPSRWQGSRDDTSEDDVLPQPTGMLT